MVIAKFKVDGVTHTEYGGSVTLTPVYSGSEENKKFFELTPYGKIEMGTINKDALEEFIPGKEYQVTFTKAE